MGRYINFAIIAQEPERRVIIKNLASSFYSLILRDYFSENNIGSRLEKEDADSPELKEWFNSEYADFRYIRDNDFSDLFQLINKEIDKYERKIEIIKELNLASADAYDRAIEDIQMYQSIIIGDDGESGLESVKNELRKLRNLVEFAVDDWNSATEQNINYGKGEVIIAWWIG